jgi:hypothetical protein
MAAIILGQVWAHPPGAPPAGSLGTGLGRPCDSGLSRLTAGGPASGCLRPQPAGWPQVSPGGSPLPHAIQVRFRAQATGTATSRGAAAEAPPRPGGVARAPAPRPGPPRPGPAGCALCGRENPERRIGALGALAANSSAVRLRAGHAQCGRAAVANSEARAPGPWGRQRRRRAGVALRTEAVANFAAFPELVQERRTSPQTKSSPLALVPSRSMGAAAAGASPPPAALAH